MDTYSLSRNFFNWCFDNPEKVSPNHTAIYFFAIEHCNRLGGKEKFGFPTMMACDAIGIKKPQTYTKYFNDLEDWGFFKVHERSKNQYSANIISLIYALPKNGKALDKAFVKHGLKQTESMGQSNSPIIKQVNKETNKQENNKSKKTFEPPLIEDVKSFFSEKGYTEKSAQSFFDYYSAGDWVDSQGTKVKNWKQKAIAIWFKPENENKENQIDLKTHAPIWKFENGQNVTKLKDGSSLSVDDYYGNELQWIDKVLNWRKCR